MWIMHDDNDVDAAVEEAICFHLLIECKRASVKSWTSRCMGETIETDINLQNTI